MLQELLLRQRVHRVVVACPASVVLQWRDELEQRFGLRFVDARQGVRQRAAAASAASASTRGPRTAGSSSRTRCSATRTTSSRSARLAGRLRAGQPAHPRRGARRGARLASASTRSTRRSRAAIRDLAPRFEHRLFLSATPHNGHSNSFSALLEILDPAALHARRARRAEGARAGDGAAAQGRPAQARRVADPRAHASIQIDVDGLPADAPELVLAEKLARVPRDPRAARFARREHTATQGRRASSYFIALQKRLLSSHRGVRAHAARPRTNAPKATAASAEGRPSASDARSRSSTRTTTTTTSPTRRRPSWRTSRSRRATRAGAPRADEARARKLLDGMTAIADGAPRPARRRRSRAILAWIRENQCPDLRPARAERPSGRRRVRRVEAERSGSLIFTEYGDTKRYLASSSGRRSRAPTGPSERILTFHGGMDEETREEVKRAFNDDRKHPVRILIAHRRRARGREPPGAVRRPLPLRRALEPGPHGAAQRPHRPHAPAASPRCAATTSSTPSAPRIAVLEALVKKTRRIQDAARIASPTSSSSASPARSSGGISARDAPSARSRRSSGAGSGGVRRARRGRAGGAGAGARRARLRRSSRSWTGSTQKAREPPRPPRPRASATWSTSAFACAGVTAARRRGADRPADATTSPRSTRSPAPTPTWRDILDTLAPPRTEQDARVGVAGEEPAAPGELRALDDARVGDRAAPPPAQAHAAGARAVPRPGIRARTSSRASRSCSDPIPLPQARPRAGPPLLLRQRRLAPARGDPRRPRRYWAEGDDRGGSSPSRPRGRGEGARVALRACSAVASSRRRLRPHREDAHGARAPARRGGPLGDGEEAGAGARHCGRGEARGSGPTAKPRRWRASSRRSGRPSRRSWQRQELPRRRSRLDRSPWLPEEKDQKAQYDADTRHIEKRRAALEKEFATEPERIRDHYEVKHYAARARRARLPLADDGDKRHEPMDAERDAPRRVARHGAARGARRHAGRPEGGRGQHHLGPSPSSRRRCATSAASARPSPTPALPPRHPRLVGRVRRLGRGHLPETCASARRYGESWRPNYAVRSADEEGDVRPARGQPGHDRRRPRRGVGRQAAGRRAPHQRFERLLRETGVHVGLLTNGKVLRLVYAPKGESGRVGRLPPRATCSRSTAAPSSAPCTCCSTSGASSRWTPSKRLPALLKASREYQNAVSTALAEQVLAALRALLRGFQTRRPPRRRRRSSASYRREPPRTRSTAGCVTVLMRMVFVLFAEDRGLLPIDPAVR